MLPFEKGNELPFEALPFEDAASAGKRDYVGTKEDFLAGLKGTAAYAGDLALGAVKLPVQAALAVGGKLADPKRSLQDTWETAGEAVEETYPSFGKTGGKDTAAYKAGMLPFEAYGKGLEYVADKFSMGNKDVQGAINIAGNFVPIPFVKPIAKGLGKVVETVDPGLRNITAQKHTVIGADEKLAAIKAAKVAEATQPKPMEPTNELNQMPLFDQPEMGRVANPYEAKLGDWRVDENGMPVKVDLSMELANLEEPLQKNLWGDELDPVRNPVGQSADLFAENGQQQGIPLTDAIDSMAPADRTAAINSELRGEVKSSPELEAAVFHANNAAESLGPLKIKPVAAKKTDSIKAPVAPETVAQRIDLANKERSGGLTNQYQRVSTPEQALAMIDPATDISKLGNNQLRSGSEAVVRTNVKNAPVNWMRGAFQEARNLAETMSKKYITGPAGVIKKIKSLSPEEADRVAETLLAADKHQMELTPEILDSLGLTPKQKEAVTAIREALDARYALANDVAMKNGYEAFPYRKGYIPSMFNGAYVKFVGYTDDKGKWRTVGIAQADTKWGLQAALDKYKEMGYTETVDGGFRGLKDTTGRNTVYNGFAAVVARFAELDGDFALAKKIADQAGSDQVRALYRFDTHELKKSDVMGNLGNRPWLSKAENTKQLFEAIVNYAEEGYRYDAMQDPLMAGQKLATEPKLMEQMPNTAKYMEDYMANIRGSNLNAWGAAGNATINKLANLLGGSQKHPREALAFAQSVSTSLMMGFGNLGFAVMQLTQPFTGGMPEALRIKEATGLSTADIGASLVQGPMAALQMAIKQPKFVAPHLVEAYNWAKEKGMFDFSEAELVHELGMSKGKKLAKDVINSSINLSEKATRPPVFMAYVDMFNKAGYKGEEALLRAQAATDYAMANYHPDERPPIYAALGELGRTLSALSTYKHNFVEQTVSTAINAAKGRELGAAGLYVALAMSLYGLSGLPGYQDADSVVKLITDKSIREFLMDDPEKVNPVMEGLASWYTGYDIQSRVSTSRILPDWQHPLSVAPHINNTVNILGSAFSFAKNQDQASFNDMAYRLAPSSFRNVGEELFLTDEAGWVRDTQGRIKVEQPRTQDQREIRAGFGVRPVQERVQDETLWTKRQREKVRMENLKEAAAQYKKAVQLRDNAGGEAAVKKYIANGGNPETLYNSVEGTVTNQQMTPKARAAGIPSDDLATIMRYQGIMQ